MSARPASCFSRTHRTRIGLARALVGRPGILVLENTLANLPGRRRPMERRSASMRAARSSHHPDEDGNAAGFDRVIRFDGARVDTQDSCRREGFGLNKGRKWVLPTYGG